ncbi:MAG: hypothetical protein IPG39_17550 [Bacteroidetes bacterium]|nr:hypothetical protein [Bacteroidota bacterium]
MNNDTEVPPDFLAPLVETFKKHTNAGIVSPKIIFLPYRQIDSECGHQCD